MSIQEVSCRCISKWFYGFEEQIRLPLELSETSRTNDKHRRLVKVDDIKEHVARIFCMPGLTRERNIEFCALQEGIGLSDEDVCKALSLITPKRSDGSITAKEQII
jgi:hypothetical protein